MKRWQIVYGLPLEVWVDIFSFPWISREQFGQLVDKIGNFKFAEHAQFFLHEWGRRTMGKLYFDEYGLCKFVDGKQYRLEYPQTPLPENIKSFDYIQIHHLDMSTIDFLAQIRPLLTDLEIGAVDIPPNCLDNFRAFLTTLAPMLDGIRKLYCGSESVFPMLKEQLFREDEKLAKLKWFKTDFFTQTEQQENLNFIVNWLAQPDSGGPRLLECNSGDDFTQILMAIREQFHAAKTPRTFAVNLKIYCFEERPAAGFHLENGIGEALHGEWIEFGCVGVFQITRHGVGRKTEEVREWIKAMTNGREDRTIWIYNPTVGPLNAPQEVVPPFVEEQDVSQQQKPGSSKDA